MLGQGGRRILPCLLISLIMNVPILLLVLILHWIADFVIQSHWQATNKSNNIIALLTHTLTYSLVWFIAALIYSPNFVSNKEAAAFLVILPLTNFIFHTVTDYFTSKWTAYLYAKDDYHNFFVVIGLDQVLHYLQLFITIDLLLQWI